MVLAFVMFKTIGGALSNWTTDTVSSLPLVFFISCCATDLIVAISSSSSLRFCDPSRSILFGNKFFQWVVVDGSNTRFVIVLFPIC